MSALDLLKEKMKGLRQSRNAVLLGLVLTILVTVTLTVITYLWVSQILCFLPMLVALLAYGIPTYFGFKDRKNLGIFGIGLFMVIGLSLGGALYTTIDNYEPQIVSSADNSLINGTVSPSHGQPGDPFYFTVTLTSPSNDSDVRLLLVNNWGGVDDNRNLSMEHVANNSIGWEYALTLSDMEEGIYYYSFFLKNETAAVFTSQSFGPVNADMGVVLSNSLFSGIMVAFLNMAVLFYILILLTWWMERSKRRVFEMEKKRAKTKEKKAVDEKFVCSDCGAEVPADADRCPSCGARFDDDEELKCPQCGAKILKSDEKCWNCGKKL